MDYYKSILQPQNGEESIKVAVRIRPLNGRENRKRDPGRAAVPLDPWTVGVRAGEAAVAASFRCGAGCYGEGVGQAEVFRGLGGPALVDAALAGYRATCFAYGQTGAGKTYSMVGAAAGGADGFEGGADWEEDSGVGLLPRAVHYLFQRVRALRERHPASRYRVRVGCLEIYSEQVYDLLVAEKARRPLGVKEHPREGFYVEGARVLAAPDAQTALRAIARALTHRRIGSHLMNARSNRSHCLCTLYVDAFADGGDGLGGEALYGALSAVDLAGSERLKETGSVGQTMREAAAINTSLYTLGKVITAIVKGQGRVPFRDSKLTKLLQGSLGGSARTLMLACVGPAKVTVPETMRTLKFAMGVACIKNRPVAVTKADPQSQVIHELKEEVQRLRQENAQLRQTLMTAPPALTRSFGGTGEFAGGGGGGAPPAAMLAFQHANSMPPSGTTPEQQPGDPRQPPVPQPPAPLPEEEGDDDEYSDDGFEGPPRRQEAPGAEVRAEGGAGGGGQHWASPAPPGKKAPLTPPSDGTARTLPPGGGGGGGGGAERPSTEGLTALLRAAVGGGGGGGGGSGGDGDFDFLPGGGGAAGQAKPKSGPARKKKMSQNKKNYKENIMNAYGMSAERLGKAIPKSSVLNKSGGGADSLRRRRRLPPPRSGGGGGGGGAGGRGYSGGSPRSGGGRGGGRTVTSQAFEYHSSASAGYHNMGVSHSNQIQSSPLNQHASADNPLLAAIRDVQHSSPAIAKAQAAAAEDLPSALGRLRFFEGQLRQAKAAAAAPANPLVAVLEAQVAALRGEIAARDPSALGAEEEGQGAGANTPPGPPPPRPQQQQQQQARGVPVPRPPAGGPAAAQSSPRLSGRRHMNSGGEAAAPVGKQGGAPAHQAAAWQETWGAAHGLMNGGGGGAPGQAQAHGGGGGGGGGLAAARLGLASPATAMAPMLSVLPGGGAGIDGGQAAPLVWQEEDYTSRTGVVGGGGREQKKSKGGGGQKKGRAVAGRRGQARGAAGVLI